MKYTMGNSIGVEHSVWSEKAIYTKKNIPIDWSGRVKKLPTWLRGGDAEQYLTLLIGRVKEYST